MIGKEVLWCCGVVVLWCCGVVVLNYPITKCLDLMFRDYLNHETLLTCVPKDDLIPKFRSNQMD